MRPVVPIITACSLSPADSDDDEIVDAIPHSRLCLRSNTTERAAGNHSISNSNSSIVGVGVGVRGDKGGKGGKGGGGNGNNGQASSTSRA